MTLDFEAVATITLGGGAGSMARYNMGRFGVSRDQIRVNSALPDVVTAQQILIGGSFRSQDDSSEATSDFGSQWFSSGE